MSKSRNYTLELMKLLAAYMVVFIHVPFYGQGGQTMSALARFAVPLFFVVSGFYSYQMPADRYLKRAKNIFLLFLIGMGFFTTCKMGLFVLSRDIQGIPAYFGEYLDAAALTKLLVFNVPVHADYLWYLLAMLYVYSLFYLLVKFRVPENVVFAGGITLLVLFLILGEGKSLVGEPFVLRCFIDKGIPFFVLGQLAKKYAQRLRSLPAYVAWSAIVFGVAATLVSRFALREQETYLGSVLIVLGLIAISVKYADAHYPSWVRELTSCSTYIYLTHAVLSGIMMRGYAMVGINYAASMVLQCVHPLLVCVVSTVFAYGMTKTIHKWVFRK